jgi:HMG box factor
MGSASTEYPHSSAGSYYHHHQSPYPPPYQRTPHPFGGKPEFDESLRLPPLQTHQLGSPHSPEIGESSGISASSAGMRRGGSGVSMVGSGPSGVGPGAAPRPSSAGGPPPIESTGSGLGLGILHPTGPAGFQSWSSSSSSSHRPPAAGHSPNPAQREHEALVMSIPFVNKLRVLGRISPPLRTGVGQVHGGGTSRLERGPVIAIEGPDSKLVNAVAVVVGRAIKEAAPPPVDGTGTWEVRCWEDDGLGGGAGGDAGSGRDATEGKDREDVVMAEVGAEGDEPSRSQRRGSQVTTRASITTATAAGKEPDIINKYGNPFVTYLHTILNWHAKSAEIIQFVTGNDTPTTTTIRTSLASTPSSSSIPTPTPTPTVATQSQSQSQPLQQQHHQQRHSTSTTTSVTTSQEAPERISISTGKTPNPPPSSASDVSPSTVNIPTNQSNTKIKTLPIALLPSGFSLTLSDRFACSIPITDAYEAVDHWQWMATLWRGIVGADLVVYVHSSATDGGESGAPGGGVLGTGTNGSVEVRNASLMVVKVPLATAVGNVEGPQGAGAVPLDDKIERRLGFEVVEWVRSGGWVTGERQRLAAGWEY